MTNDASGDPSSDTTEDGPRGSTHNAANHRASAGSKDSAIFGPVKFVPGRASRHPAHGKGPDD
ncbi:MAG: hypothetical protein PF795_11975 [Kiritimatiellae bacterium]|nr:hypothetical protein [Kiritimatiellia bacterium]